MVRMSSVLRRSSTVGAFLVTVSLLLGCGGSSGNASSAPPQSQAATPAISPAAEQGGAVVVTLSTTTGGGTVYYTTDGSTPTSSSTVYEAPFLVASNLTVKAITAGSGLNVSNVASQSFSPNIASGTLVWSEDFNNAGSTNTEPNPAIWTYDTGNNGWGNNELEDYCGWGSTTSPCNPASPNAYVGTDGALHIVAEQPATGVYTSARLKTQGLFSFQYGRIEARIQVPEEQGLWPAFWMLGNNIATINWPGSGEMDIMERVNAATTPDFNEGSIHGTGFTGTNLGARFSFPAGETAAGWHTYGMIWKPGSVSYYVDDPSQPYVTYTTSSITSLSGSVWPFDAGPSFVILNLAVGGDYPGAPNSSTAFPAQLVVDYIHIYTN
uniref:Glycoside hydrolase, family 16 n=1 Tax=mine drainage metagenome TaxID=410659 RepID=E6PYL1_9ZZZZ